MSTAPIPAALHILLLLFSGLVNSHQQRVLDYLLEENRVLREQLDGRRLRLTDDQRRRLAVKGKLLGSEVLAKLACIATPETILRWYRRLVAKNYDGSKKRRPGRLELTAGLVTAVSQRELCPECVEIVAVGRSEARPRGRATPIGAEVGPGSPLEVVLDTARGASEGLARVSVQDGVRATAGGGGRRS